MAEKEFWMASGRFAVPEAAAWATQPYHMGVRVLVCADLFDQEAPYSQGLGLGVAVNRPPIPKTLYYAGTITKEFMKKDEVQVCFRWTSASATSTSKISTAGLETSKVLSISMFSGPTRASDCTSWRVVSGFLSPAETMGFWFVRLVGCVVGFE